MQLTKAHFSAIEEQLLKLFPLEPVPKLRLADALVMDGWGYRPPGLPEERWKNWLEIPDGLLNKYELLLTYFMGADLIYFIPRFVLQLVKEGGVNGKDFSNATSSFMDHLARWHSSCYRKIPINPLQREFLDWVLREACTNEHLRSDAYG